MARHKAFDPDQIVNRAMALFRLRGYAATSVDDLVQHLGIGRGSLYDTFGSKHALFLAALDRYLAQNGSSSLPSQPLPAKVALGILLAQQVEHAIAMAPGGGCLLVNATAELALHDDEVAQRIHANLADAERLIATLIAADPATARTAQECQQLAQFFVNTILGIRLHAKATPDHATLTAIAEMALRVLG